VADDRPKPTLARAAAIAALGLVLVALLLTVFAAVGDVRRVKETFDRVDVPLPGLTLIALPLAEILQRAWWAMAIALVGIAVAVASGALDELLGVVFVVCLVLLRVLGGVAWGVRAPLMQIQRAIK